MKAWTWKGIPAAAALLAIVALPAVLPAPASARGFAVELWTDRGNDAVYMPGDPILIKTRVSDDAYLLVYEIDAEGSVNLLFPTAGNSSAVDGRRIYHLPDEDQNELVVDNVTGQGYIVALASERPFEDLPWYLRPYDAQAEELGYVGREEDEEGVTREGRIVGDPFVAMERIRRRVLQDPRNEDGFATAYTSYYVHDRVRYPRYICYDCHRPGRYEWWSGFDPYYTTCSVFDFRVNWSWGWGPRYWFGTVPYFVYVYRPDCPPHYRRYGSSWYSSWDGWTRWCDLWGNGGLRRYRTSPPAGYVPPEKYFSGTGERTRRELPPGFLATTANKPGGIRERVGVGGGHWVGDQGGRTRTSERERRGDSGIRGGGREVRPDGRAREEVGDRPARGNRGGLGGTRTAEPPRFGRARDESGRRDDAPAARDDRRPERPRYEARPSDRPRESYRPPERREERAPVEYRRPESRAPEPRPEYRAPERRAPDPPREFRAPERRAPDPPQARTPDPPRPKEPSPPPAKEDRGDRGDRGNSGNGRRER